MAVRQINTADFDYAMMLETIIKSYKGKAAITISEYSTSAAPVVKVGSVFEDNGAFFIVETSDITPTGYAGITNSTTFYLYWDESASVFIYSNTAPTWSDVLQDWYNSNDRAFFSMFKDSGGTLYERKCLLLTQNNLQIGGGIQTDNAVLKTKVIEIGDWNMDTTTDLVLNHGISDPTKIICVDGLIRNDADSTRYAFFSNTGGNMIQIVGSTIRPSIVTGGLFDAGIFVSTSYNRGWLIITYEG